ncbi:TIM-barrel domain-containing protein [Lewinella sp. IMCC34183]|uniref:glycoside hydrolase family 31 protein n=1 Tax=Lewinella sp. IMCC34183 TaxID=2248762 RepID=UPI000E27E8DB|nr:TIM-barrel domain-containing protein [Lewinella sp. IMCC34183]
MVNVKQGTPRLPYQPAPGTVFEGDTLSTLRYEDVYYNHSVGRISEVRRIDEHRFAFVSEGTVFLVVEIWSDHLVRFTYGYRAPAPDFSYARAPEARPAAATLRQYTEGSGHYLETAALRIHIDGTDGAVAITELASGTELHRQATPFYARTTLMKGLDQVRVQLLAAEKEHFYGLGDKAWDTDLRGRTFENWTTDSFAYGRERDALYRAVPFFYGLRDGRGYGVFLDNTYRTHFDFDSNGDGLVTLWADGGAFDYYFIAGPQLDRVASRYAGLTGVPELPPLWSLGYHQCRWSYYPEERVREVADAFRVKAIPCDAIYLDIDYMDEYRCFTWNPEYFPDPKEMISALAAEGFHTVVMIDPGIRVDEDYPVYAEGVKIDAFCRRSTGEQMVGPVWPPQCVWPDYTNPRVRDWWGQLYRELYVEQGVSGFWNDMNEPAMFKVNAMTFPPDVRHDFDGQTGDHKKAHNIYGMQMARATYEGLRKLQPAKRPFLLARANYSGGQRFASLWTGDNIASWEHLALANRQCLRLSISGYSFVGTDIGGFVDDPSPELLTRWLQLAVFHPLMRIHSMGNNTDGAAEAEADEVKEAEANNRQDQEPWVHGGEHTDRNRKAIELRYRLLPYLYTAFERHVATGVPVLRNLFFYDQNDARCRKYADQFLAGEDLLVCPVVQPGVKSLTVYLPRGNWYSFWTGKRFEGGRTVRIRLHADRLPIFVRAGAIVPTVPVVQHTAALRDAERLELSVYLDNAGTGSFYWDAGDGYGYETGQYSRRTFTLVREGGAVTVEQAWEGDFRSGFQTMVIQLIGLNEAPGRVTVDGNLLPDAPRFDRQTASVEVPYDFRRVVIE